MATFLHIKEPDMSTAQTLPTVFSGSNTGWEASLYAFLAEKQRRSGSNRTPDSYYRTLRHFFGNLQKSPDKVSRRRMSSLLPTASASLAVNLLSLPSAPASPASLPSSSSSSVSISSRPSMRSRGTPQASAQRTQGPLRFASAVSA